MTTSEFRQTIKEQLDKVDKGEKILITRGGKIYTVTRVTSA